jgi:hypothetical protein
MKGFEDGGQENQSSSALKSGLTLRGRGLDRASDKASLDLHPQPNSNNMAPRMNALTYERE